MEHSADFATFRCFLYEHLLVNTRRGETFLHLWWKYPKNTKQIYDRQEYRLLSAVVVDVHVGFIMKKRLISDGQQLHQFWNRCIICSD